MRIKILKDWATGAQYLHDTDLDCDYRRILAGVAWPTEARPGAMVLLSEERDRDPAFLRHHLHVLLEHTTERPEALMDTMDFAQDDFGALVFHGELGMLAKIRVNAHNDDLDLRRKPRLRVWTPPMTPGSEGLLARVRLLLDRVKGEKTLHFGQGSLIPAAVGPLLVPGWEEDDLQPLALACLAAVTAADLSQPGEFIERAHKGAPSSVGY